MHLIRYFNVDLNKTDELGHTPLHRAAKNNDCENVWMILHSSSSVMKTTKLHEIGQLNVDYDIVDNNFRRSDEIRLPVSVISKIIKKKRKHILREHTKNKAFHHR